MLQKILTVDDSRTVRLLVKKAFKAFDCEVFEAANGEEGLAMAAKVQPGVILLDVTMPVMDGVAMLVKLKADPKLKNIPVIMLTAEGGRGVVMDIAKLGVRSYIVKPFKEDTLLEKVGLIIALAPKVEVRAKPMTVVDPVELLIVEDKEAIVQQISQRFVGTSWQIRSVAQTADAATALAGSVPDLIVISLSLPDGAAFAFFRKLKESPRTAQIPIFGLAVKTDTAIQSQAQESGFTGVITKPIDFSDLESRVARALHLDTSPYYFRIDGACLVIKLPPTCPPFVLAEIATMFPAKLGDAVNSGVSRVLVDLTAIESLPMDAIKVIVGITQQCSDLSMKQGLVAAPGLAADCQAFEESRGWTFHPDFATAKQHLGLPPTPVAAVAA